MGGKVVVNSEFDGFFCDQLGILESWAASFGTDLAQYQEFRAGGPRMSSPIAYVHPQHPKRLSGC